MRKYFAPSVLFVGVKKIRLLEKILVNVLHLKAMMNNYIPKYDSELILTLTIDVDRVVFHENHQVTGTSPPYYGWKERAGV